MSSIEGDVRAPRLPLSSSQRNIWNAERAFGDTPANIICSTIKIRGAFEPETLERCLALTMEREETLRTRVSEENGEPYQYCAAYSPERFPFLDFSLTDSDGLAHWEEAVTREPMRLDSAPLCRFYIFRTGETEGGILVKIHHIISDGYSEVLLSNRIAETYLALVSGGEPPELARRSYGAHIEKELRYLASPAAGRDREFWEERLRGFTAPSDVRERAASSVSRVGRRRTFRLTNVLGHAIRDFCTKHRVAPFSVYCMALLIYLARTGGGERASIGVPVVNRSDFEDKETLGMFVSTVPFICDTNDEWSFERFNSELTLEWLELLKHQRLPFTELLDMARATRPEIDGLFSIVLSYQESRLYESPDASVTFSGRWRYSGYQNERLIIHLSSLEDDARFSVDYDYLTQIFTERDIEKLHSCLTTIIASALADEGRPVWSLPMIDEAETERAVYGFNSTYERLPFEDAGAMLMASASEHPKRAALISGGKRMTYGELLSDAKGRAAALARLPLGSVVALELDKGFELVSLMAASLLSGNTWLTVPRDTPGGRLAELLRDSGAALLIGEEGDRAPEGIAFAVPADIVSADEPAQKPPARAAYIVYTSGSTGKPKGVEISPRSLVNLALAVRPLYGHGAVISLCSTGFDVFIMETMAALLNGRTLVLPTKEDAESPSATASLIRGYGVGNIALPPSRLCAYMRDGGFCAALAGVESIVCGGERFPGELLARIAAYSKARVYNEYGPSEAAVAVSAGLVNGARQITAGAPLANCRLYVLDRRLQPLPIGVWGELYIGGASVGLGYKGREALTKEKFLPSPFEPGETIYSSGDVACWTEEGEIALAGRLDSEVKLRGQRIEPGEIASRVAGFPGVADAAVKLVRSGNAELIAAYYCSGAPIDEAALFDHLRAYLPNYMLPAAITRLERIPLTANGKTDYAALPDPEPCGGCGEGATPFEMSVLAALRRSIGKEDMGVSGDYFLFGGDSLSAMEALAIIEAETGTRFTVSELYSARTARRLASLKGRGGATARDTVKKAPPMEDYPVAATELGIYLECAREPESTAYNMPGAFLLPKDVDVERLASALDSLAANEPMLRASFRFMAGGLKLHISKDGGLPLERLEAASFEEAARRFVRPFRLDEAPLARAALFCADRGSYLFIDTHHIISDGISSAILMDRLDRLYRGETPGEALSFADYALHTASFGPNAENEAYWKEILSAPPAPLELGKPFGPEGAAAKELFSPGQAVDGKLSEYCARNKTSRFALICAAFGAFLSFLTDAGDMLVCTPVSARAGAELKNVVGPFIRPLPLRLRIKDGMTAAELINETASSVIGMMEHCDIPSTKLSEYAGGLRYDAMISMRPREDSSFELGGERLEAIALDAGRAKYALSLEAYDGDDGLSFALEYDASRFDAQSAALLARSYTAILSALVSDDAAKLADIPRCSAADAAALFTRPERTRTPFVDMPLFAFILERASLDPDAPAVVSSRESVSFGELAKRALEIAGALVSRGVKKGDVVALAPKRSTELMAELIGINMAGAAYMPLLPGYPVERARYMLGIAGAKLVLSADAAISRAAELAGIFSVRPEELSGADAALPALSEFGPDDPAYVLFTSGTTGKPKGVVNTHSAAANLLSAMERIMGEGNSRVLSATNAVFDIFITESLLPLALGKTVVLADEEEALLPWKLAELIEGHDVTLAQATPSRLSMYLGNDRFRESAKRLDTMILVGEKLELSLVSRFRAATGAKLYNMYGPTEAAVYVSFVECSREKERVTIGRPLQNCRIYVLDGAGRRSMPLARGELYLAGTCLSTGYINEPGLTKGAFLPDPFFPGERMYKTGDTARLLANGEIEFIGRADSQIKIDGQRVEPDEVACRLREAEGVAAAAVVPVRDGGNVHLRACVAMAEGREADAEALRRALASTLPKHMIPAEFVFYASLPLTSSGKLDLCTLAEAGAGRAAPEERSEPASPASPVAREATADALDKIWRGVLSREPERDVSFFEQGGSSLAALNAISLYYNEGFGMSVAEFYAHPTINGQLALLRGKIPQESGRPDGSARKPGSVLITGASGFLGAHLAHEFIEEGTGEVICLAHSGAKPLVEALVYYFGREWTKLAAKRLLVVNGDVSLPSFGLGRDAMRRLAGAALVVNAAADVRHYASDTDAFMRTNAGGAENAAALAGELGARLIHISTVSVSSCATGCGPFAESDWPSAEGEANLYVRSKALAELAVKKAAENGLEASIIRVGRLVGRASDGMFQREPGANAFYSFVRAALSLERIPHGAAGFGLDITPVDECARATALLSSGACGVYHAFNPNAVTLGEILSSLGGGKQETVSDEEFGRYLGELMRKRPDAALVQLADAYRAMASGRSAQPDAGFTVRTLGELGFEWKKPDIRRVLRCFK